MLNRLSGHTVKPVAHLEVRACALPADARTNAAIIKMPKDEKPRTRTVVR